MDIVFEALVKNSEDGSWFIELKDTFSGAMEICEDLKAFEQKIQDMGENYGGRIDKVEWLSDDNLTPENMQKVRVAMMEYHEKYKDQLDEQKTEETK